MPGLVDFATGLLGALHATLAQTIARSLAVSLSATLIASALGLPLGTALAIYRFPGRNALILAANALLGLPPVVVGVAALRAAVALGSAWRPGFAVHAGRHDLGAKPARTARRHRPGASRHGGNLAPIWRRTF